MREPPMVMQGDAGPELVPPSRADAVFQHLSALVAAMNAENTGAHAENELLNELRALGVALEAVRVESERTNRLLGAISIATSKAAHLQEQIHRDRLRDFCPIRIAE